MPILPDYPRFAAVKRLGAKWPVTASIDIRERGGGGVGGNSLEILVLHAGYDSLQISQYWLGFALI